MEISLYKNLSDNNVLDKNLELVTTITTKANTDIDILRPYLEFYYSKILDFNYFYIKDFSRYYFLQNFDTLENNHYRLNGYIDVLETYKDKIKECKCIVSKMPKKDFYPNNIENELISNFKKTSISCNIVRDEPIFIIFGQSAVLPFSGS